MQHEKELISLVKNTPEFNEIHQILTKYHLQDALICSGALRNLVWNKLTNRSNSILSSNLDILYTNPAETYEQMLTLRAIITQSHSKYLWNLQNTALNNVKTRQPFGKNRALALESVPETCSAVGVFLTPNNEIKVIAPFGLENLFNMEIHPTPRFVHDPTLLKQFKRRVISKKWGEIWPQLTFFDN
ncbi:nucleotidyltransferase family protein [Liquorilactobacillus oeni]|uniref:Nucleotidyltransferase family protein n=1 Tax=Liquorilactobacillus oeni DSM 19972 TaxID=1423777 RepID=A0A0R1MI50_9LACO|nr:nucleotidyltransferase family protein [Liquorilactobacillus oeni]KRL04949.1 hypothetical protein FD46_GL001173 [Liquorilactobacillus oeni DSM 19972]